MQVARRGLKITHENERLAFSIHMVSIHQVRDTPDRRASKWNLGTYVMDPRQPVHRPLHNRFENQRRYLGIAARKRQSGGTFRLPDSESNEDFGQLSPDSHWMA